MNVRLATVAVLCEAANDVERCTVRTGQDVLGRLERRIGQVAVCLECDSRDVSPCVYPEAHWFTIYMYFSIPCIIAIVSH
jgi:hypothetical protein